MIRHALSRALQPAINAKRWSGRYRRFRQTVAQDLSRDGQSIPTELDIGRYRRSDTLFVLGSGASVNDYTPAQWKTISQHDTAALSFWLYHDFVPAFFFFELPRVESQSEVLFQLMSLRRRDYASTAVIMNDLSMAAERCPDWAQRLPFREFPRFHALHNVGVPGRTVPAFERWLRWYDLAGVFEPRSRLWYLPKKRASLSMLIAFAVLAGYRKIVFCGVDLKGGYFYEAPQYQRPGWPVLEAPQAQSHSTVAIQPRRLPIDEVVCSMQRVLLTPRGIELYVALSSSGLYPRVPCYFH